MSGGLKSIVHQRVTLTEPYDVKCKVQIRRRLLLLTRRLLRLLSFSLLSHFAALLATMVWRCRNSAAADRRALHSDYTSATEKTPSPLNGRCTQAQKPSPFAPTRDRKHIARNNDTRIRARNRAKFQDDWKPRWNLRFRAYREFNFGFACTIKTARGERIKT